MEVCAWSSAGCFNAYKQGFQGIPAPHTAHPWGGHPWAESKTITWCSGISCRVVALSLRARKACLQWSLFQTVQASCVSLPPRANHYFVRLCLHIYMKSCFHLDCSPTSIMPSCLNSCMSTQQRLLSCLISADQEVNQGQKPKMPGDEGQEKQWQSEKGSNFDSKSEVGLWGHVCLCYPDSELARCTLFTSEARGVIFQGTFCGFWIDFGSKQLFCFDNVLGPLLGWMLHMSEGYTASEAVEMLGQTLVLRTMFQDCVIALKLQNLPG